MVGFGVTSHPLPQVSLSAEKPPARLLKLELFWAQALVEHSSHSAPQALSFPSSLLREPSHYVGFVTAKLERRPGAGRE